MTAEWTIGLIQQGSFYILMKHLENLSIHYEREITKKEVARRVPGFITIRSDILTMD